MIDEEVQAFIEHYGKKGMHWGVRRATKRTNKEARKDAEEFARAKMFYGKGAGTRRKLINETVKAKSKKDSTYAKAFEKHLQDQDMSTHASKARSERSRKDKKEKTRQVAGSVARRFTGEMGTTAAFVAAAGIGAKFASSPKGRSMMGKTVASVKMKFGSKSATDFLKAYGLG